MTLNTNRNAELLPKLWRIHLFHNSYCTNNYQFVIIRISR